MEKKEKEDISKEQTSDKVPCLKEPDGTLRCLNSLELLGRWFEVDNITYVIWKKNLC